MLTPNSNEVRNEMIKWFDNAEIKVTLAFLMRMSYISLRKEINKYYSGGFTTFMVNTFG